jgi:hypothetical protein
MTEQTVEEVLAEAAKASEAAVKPKKERKPKAEAGAEGATEPKAKKERKPKEPKAPKLDKDGNPIAPKARNAVRDDQTLHITDKGVEAKFREGTKRHENFAAIKDGMTAKEYFEKVEGGRASVGTFLVWYINEGYVEVGGNTEAAAAAE